MSEKTTSELVGQAYAAGFWNGKASCGIRERNGKAIEAWDIGLYYRGCRVFLVEHTWQKLDKYIARRLQDLLRSTNEYLSESLSENPVVMKTIRIEGEGTE